MNTIFGVPYISLFACDFKSTNKPVKTIKIFPLSNWATSETLCNIWSKMSKDGFCSWKTNNINIQLTYTNPNPDYYLVINWLNNIETIEDLKKIKIDPKKIIILHMEPYINKHPIPDLWKNPTEDIFYKVLNHENYRNTLEWHLSLNINELQCKDHFIKTKGSCISAILSNKKIDIGHIKRIELIKALSEDIEFTQDITVYNKDSKYIDNEFNMDIFGTINPIEHKIKECKNIKYKGELPYQMKDKGLFTYKYHFNGENNKIKNYTTEKIIDAILSECLIFYWGDETIDTLINPMCYIKLPYSNDFKEDIKIIKDTIRNNEWEKRIKYIREAKKLILYKYQMFPMLATILK